MIAEGLTQHDWRELKELLAKANDMQLSEIRRQCLTEGWTRQARANEKTQRYYDDRKTTHGI